MNAVEKQFILPDAHNDCKTHKACAQSVKKDNMDVQVLRALWQQLSIFLSQYIRTIIL